MPYQNVLDNFEQLRSLGGKDAAFPALERLAATDPAAAQQWLQAHPVAWEGATGAAFQADPFGSREPLMNVMKQALLTGNGDVAKMSDKLADMSNTWARSYGQTAQAEAWAQAQTNPAVRAPVLLGIVEATYDQARPGSKTLAYWKEAQQLDPAAAAKSNVYWVNTMVSQLNGPLPSDVVSTFTNQQLARIFQDRPQLLNPNDAMAMSLQIQDYNERQNASYEVIETYRTSNPQEVQEWIQQLPTDEERAAVTNRLADISRLQK